MTTTGVSESMVVPFPSRPEPFRPQHRAEPFASAAHECSPPAEIATTWESDETVTGVKECVALLPFPSRPLRLSPQHRAVPFASTAHEWEEPAEIATTVVSPETVTGVAESVFVPLPRRPEPFLPQQRADPFANTAHEWVLPAEIATALVSPGTVTGVNEGAEGAMPSSPYALPPQQRTVPFARTAQA